jgi:hypothetical protein
MTGERETYLGNGLYASFDRGQVKLRGTALRSSLLAIVRGDHGISVRLA